ncbi:MAG: glycosyltransferase [Candidatus Saccharibacteria bacterium]|nr:glycosyltransferase [Candidatus Saccharibacteria bacterium]
MTDAKQKIWIDVTDLSVWSGHFTGTQRVTYEMSLRFYEQISDVHFFAYNERARNFYEVDFGPINQTILASRMPAEAGKRPSGFHRPSPKAVLRTQSLKAYHNLPFRVKQQLTPARREQLKKAYRTFNSVSSRVKPRRQVISSAAVPGAPAVHFQKADIVVILGKPWDTMTFIDVLRDQKTAQPFKLVHLVYDMIPTFLPQVFGQPLPANYTKYMFEALALSDRVIAISKSTKQDVARFCREELLQTPKTTVVRLGDTPNGLTVLEDKYAPSGLKPGSFILCVGTIEVRKNHALLYAAYKEAQLRDLPMPTLVIIGSRGWYTGDVIYQFQHDPLLRHSVKILHGLSDEQVDWLYGNCAFTVYPSVYEGWGLPVAESLAKGKVCIASHASSMPEIAGDLIEYFSPYDAPACLALIQKYLSVDVRRAKEAEIQAKYKITSWDKTFAQVADAVSS